MKSINLELKATKDYFVGEAIKALRTNVQFCGTDVKAIAVTSCHPNEGKSTISLELANSLAQVGKKVLFIDADMRKSVIVKKYVAGTGICGLSQYLSGQSELEDVLYATQTDGFHIIFAGQFPANPVELLNSTAFKTLIEEQTKVYDYVIVDTPPLGMVIDCAVISNICDSAIMVIAAGRVSNRRAMLIKNQLSKSGVHILGVVLNMINKRGGNYPMAYGAYSKRYGGARSGVYGSPQPKVSAERVVIAKDEY